ncbi:RING-H2 finger protein ATL40 [Dendrobium catenatum]|uniref:RING-type E3 ubiquitin transferase n=1 Tax=Dendrobium catenatum TaxID=906689 RepID=A0A2I0WAJ2_9ASPA|nr:RING-H2 finger protein ATL40 [Dendrobium catenatum]
MASHSIPRSSTSAWIGVGSHPSTLQTTSCIPVIAFVLFLIFIAIVVTIARLVATCLLHRLQRRRSAVAVDTLTVNHFLQPASSAAGLVDSAIASLPTFVYLSNDDNDNGRTGSQCAVCLSAVEEGETMRMLPNCKHFFHVKCVDKWLHSHPTCPVCRADVKRWHGAAAGVGRLLASPAMPARRGEVVC